MKIAVLPGDGIGPEIVAQAVKVLEALRSDGLKIEMEHAHIGGAGYDAAKDPLPEATLKLSKESDAVLLGAVGGYQYDNLPRPMRPEQGLLRIRKGLGLFANLRPAMVYPELVNASTLTLGHRVRAGYHDPARTDRRHLLRPAARHPHAGERRAPGLRYHALQRIGNSPRGACRLPDRDEAQQETVLGGQGQRAGYQHVLARNRDRSGEGISGKWRCRTCTWTTRRCSWCARPSSST